MQPARRCHLRSCRAANGFNWPPRERIAAGDVKLDRIVDEILAGGRAQKESVQVGMNAGREKGVAELKSKYRPDELRAVRFEDFFEGGALGWAEDYAVPTGVVDECRKRGLEGLL
jgi:hypothetical protein